jgi:hypothetical protein
MKGFVFFLFFILVSSVVLSQPVSPKTLLAALANRNSKLMADNEKLLLNTYNSADSADRISLLAFFDAQSGSNDAYIAARSLAWKGVVARRPPFNSSGADSFMRQAIQRAMESNDAYLQVQSMETYAADCHSQGKPETALFYYLKACELRKNLDENCFFYKNAAMYGTIGELLHKMQEYAQSTYYIQQSFSAISMGQTAYTSAFNTIGLNYQRLQQYDSAMYCYSKAIQSAQASDDSVWTGIVSGNIGSLYFEQGQDEKALPLLWKDYTSCLLREPKNAANTLHRIALIYLRRHQTDSALLLAKKALQLVQQGRGRNLVFLRNVYGALTEIFKKAGKPDSALFYGDIYHRINDSVSQMIAANRADVAQARLDFEKNNNRIQTLLQEKQAEKTWRNLLVATLVLLLIAGWLYLRWQKQRNFTRQQALLHQQQMAKAEAANARAQLETFMQSSIEKNNLLEKLQAQLQQQHMQMNDELLNQSILTENDWLRFKEMFDKVNPGFMAQLKVIAPDITTAEIRLAALTKLNLGNKHIASMLGIGTDAVRKTKSRLRLRLQIDTETDLEDFLKQVAS